MSLPIAYPRVRVPIITDPLTRRIIGTLWRGGYDTKQIADKVGHSEAEVYNTRNDRKTR